MVVKKSDLDNIGPAASEQEESSLASCTLLVFAHSLFSQKIVRMKFPLLYAVAVRTATSVAEGAFLHSVGETRLTKSTSSKF